MGHISKHYKLTTDIDLNNCQWTPITWFYGVFGGNHHTIFNLAIGTPNAPSRPKGIGLFDEMNSLDFSDNGLVINLSMKGISIYASRTGGYSLSIGGITAFLKIKKSSLGKTNITPGGEVADKKIYKINTALIQKEEAFDGFYGACTNLEEDVFKIIKINHKRWECTIFSFHT